MLTTYDLCANLKDDWLICFDKQALRVFNTDNRRNTKKEVPFEVMFSWTKAIAEKKDISHEHVAEASTYQQLSGERAR